MTTAVKAQLASQKAPASRAPTTSPPRSRRRAKRAPRSSSRAVGKESITAAAAFRPQPLFVGRHLTASGPVPTWKRSLDVFCVLVSLPLTLPLMMAVALWIKCASQGPALFRQERIGRNGKRFTLYKFRSMKMNADTGRHQRHFRHLVSSDSPMVKLDLLCDSRVITGGCLLRAAGLDELPQLFNVLRGEMSLVGPRPCLPEEFRFFTSRQRERFEALPGLTGIWQVVGKGVSTFSEMNVMDALYVRKASPALDLGIMLRTPFALLRQMREAYRQHRGNRNKAEFETSGEAGLSGLSTQRLG